MFARWAGVFLTLLLLGQTASAQDVKTARADGTQSLGVSNEALDAGVARIAVRAVVPSPMPPSQRDMLGILVLMSLRQHRGHGA